MPRRDPRKRLEASIEDSFVGWCDSEGFATAKLFIKDWPDRLVMLPSGVTTLVELKKIDGKLSPGQKLLHAQLRKLGHDVLVPKSLEEAKSGILRRLTNHEKACPIRGRARSSV